MTNFIFGLMKLTLKFSNEITSKCFLNIFNLSLSKYTLISNFCDLLTT